MPTVNDCPSDEPMVRSAGELSQQEQDWLDRRRPATVEPMRDLLSRINIQGLDTDNYINTHRNNASALPNIGIAASGGGYRAMLNGAGYLEAFDSRTPNSTSQGQLGGLLQSTTYLAGLSGGGWLVGSLYTNNFTSIYDIISPETDSVWALGNSIFVGPEGDSIQLLSSGSYYDDLLNRVQNKEDAGFNTTLTDYWGRALSYQLVNATDGGPAYTFSSIAEQSWFTDASVPLPFLVADERFPGDLAIPDNTTVFDFNPWEFGSPDPSLYAFAPLKYAGTNFTAGSPSSNECVTGFDNVGFVMGTSSSLFNQVLLRANSTNTDDQSFFTGALLDAIEAVLGQISEGEEDIADWVNPFYHYHNDTNPSADTRQLTLVDGGEDLQNIPFHPLIQPNRDVDVIFAIDSSADTNTSYAPGTTAANWPAGVAMVASYQRAQASIANGTVFPSVPDVQTFINLGLNNGPTFFGCDSSNFSADASPPLIVYLPNAPYVYHSNVSTFDLQYNDTERDAIILNAYNGATQGNGTLDENWPACVGCAILSRSLERTGTDVPDVCNRCFEKYCWDGTVDSSQRDYVPGYKLGEDEVLDVSQAAGLVRRSLGVVIGSALLAGWCLL